MLFLGWTNILAESSPLSGKFLKVAEIVSSECVCLCISFELPPNLPITHEHIASKSVCFDSKSNRINWSGLNCTEVHYVCILSNKCIWTSIGWDVLQQKDTFQWTRAALWLFSHMTGAWVWSCLTVLQLCCWNCAMVTSVGCECDGLEQYSLANWIWQRRILLVCIGHATEFGPIPALATAEVSLQLIGWRGHGARVIRLCQDNPLSPLPAHPWRWLLIIMGAG